MPRGRQLVTLEDAGNYITKLPKGEHEAVLGFIGLSICSGLPTEATKAHAWGMRTKSRESKGA